MLEQELEEQLQQDGAMGEDSDEEEGGTSKRSLQQAV